MRTAAERIEFALKFAQMDLAILRPGDWMNLRDDLQAFLGPGVPGQSVSLEDLGGIMVTPLERPLPQEFPEKDFRELQSDLRVLLARHGEGQSNRVRSIVIPTVSLRYRLCVHPASVPTVGMLSARGPTRDVTVLRLSFLLSKHAQDIRTCPEASCRRLFYRVCRKRCCSRLCVVRANKRAERERERQQQKPAVETGSRSKTDGPKKRQQPRSKKGGQ